MFNCNYTSLNQYLSIGLHLLNFDQFNPDHSVSQSILMSMLLTMKMSTFATMYYSMVLQQSVTQWLMIALTSHQTCLWESILYITRTSAEHPHPRMLCTIN